MLARGYAIFARHVVCRDCKGHQIWRSSLDGAGTLQTRTLALSGTYQFGAPPILNSADGLQFDIFIPADAPPDLRAGVHLCTLDDDWFDAVFPQLLRPGELNRFVLDLTQVNSNALRSVKSAKPWAADCRSRLFEIGIHLFSTHTVWTVNGRPQNLVMQVSPITAVRFAGKGSESDMRIAAAGTASESRKWKPQSIQNWPTPDESRSDGVNTWTVDGAAWAARGVRSWGVPGRATRRVLR